MKTTQKIAGIEITLTAGRTYRASRPMATKGRTVYPVTITDLADGSTANVIFFCDYDKANDILAAFNNGMTSFDGRTW